MLDTLSGRIIPGGRTAGFTPAPTERGGKPRDAACAAKVAGRKQRLELAQPEVIVGAGHDQQREVLLGEELIADVAEVVPVPSIR